VQYCRESFRNHNPLDSSCAAHTPQSAWQLSHTTTHWAAAVLHIHHNLLESCLTQQPTGQQLSHTTTLWTAAVSHHNPLGSSCATLVNAKKSRQQLNYQIFCETVLQIIIIIIIQTLIN